MPKLGFIAQHALILSEGIVLKAMWQMRPEELPRAKDGTHRGAMLALGSITRIARATARFVASTLGIDSASGAAGEPVPMPRRTVAHCIARLEQKGFIERWERHWGPERGETTRFKHSPYGEGWRIRRFDEVLALWANSPEVGTVRNRAFYVRGKGHRLCTPAELTAWGVKTDAAERNPRAHAAAADYQEPAPAAEAPRAPWAPPRRMTVEEHLIDDTATVHAAIRATGVLSAEPEHAAALLAMARAVDATIPAATIGGLLKSLADGYVRKAKANPAKYGWTSQGGPVFWTIGWYRNELPGAVAVWSADRARAQRAAQR